MDDLGALLAELTSGDNSRAEAAAASLPALGQKAFQPLSVLLSSAEVDKRWWAVRSLAGFEQTDALINLLITALDDEFEEVRQCAALGLCHHPHPTAVPPLIRALSDPDAMTARIASNALTRIGPEAVPALASVLKDGRSDETKLAAIRALAEIKDTRAIPVLMSALQTDSAVAQYWAELGLDALGLGMVYLKPE